MGENTAPLSVDQVVSAIERELTGGPLEAAPDPDWALEQARELQRRFRSDPVGGRLATLKRLAFWWVASAFDRQGKVIEALLVELEARAARVVALEARLARLEALVNARESDERERRR
mgnify:FL=1